ncbi:hypothetical protein [Citrobacter sp. NCU1]|nr:hypothetical protein [Citrobacter sp. NCU1]
MSLTLQAAASVRCRETVQQGCVLPRPVTGDRGYNDTSAMVGVKYSF